MPQFRQQNPVAFPADGTAQALAGVPNAKFGDYLNQAAYYGDLPLETTTADLSIIKRLKITDGHIMKELPFKNYAAPSILQSPGGICCLIFSGLRSARRHA